MSNKTWNYRVVTYIYSYKKLFGENHPLSLNPDERLFKVVSVYYEINDNGDVEPVSYGESKTDILDGFDDIQGLKFTIDNIQKAYDKPILNLDSFPDIWEE